MHRLKALLMGFPTHHRLLSYIPIPSSYEKSFELDRKILIQTVTVTVTRKASHEHCRQRPNQRTFEVRPTQGASGIGLLEWLLEWLLKGFSGPSAFNARAARDTKPQQGLGVMLVGNPETEE